MPSLDEKFLKSLDADYTRFPNFVETGTLYGETIFEMEKYFQNLYTIEVKQDLYESVKNRSKSSKISFFWGDSTEKLAEIVPSIQGPSIFFLDAHWSCGPTGKGVKDVPLLEELDIIYKQHNEEAIIIIDDVRLFGRGPSTKTETVDWELISEERVLDILTSRISKTYFLPSTHSEKDRMIVHINKNVF